MECNIIVFNGKHKNETIYYYPEKGKLERVRGNSVCGEAIHDTYNWNNILKDIISYSHSYIKGTRSTIVQKEGEYPIPEKKVFNILNY